MKTLLVSLLLLSLASAGFYYGFPSWYLNNSPHVIMQPRSLLPDPTISNEMEGNPQKPDISLRAPDDPTEPLQVMYLDEKRETRLASGFKQMELLLPIYKVGVAAEATAIIAGVEVGMTAHASRAVFEREAITVAYTSWRMVPDLTEVDLWGVDRPDTRDRRGRQVFSLIVTRAAFVRSDPRRSRTVQVAALGASWFAPEVDEQDPSPGR